MLAVFLKHLQLQHNVIFRICLLLILIVIKPWIWYFQRRMQNTAKQIRKNFLQKW